MRGLCLWIASRGMATPNSAGPLAGGMASHAQCVVAAYGALRGYDSPQRRFLWRDRGGMVAPNGAGPRAAGTGIRVESVVFAYGVPVRGWQPLTARTHWLGGGARSPAQSVVVAYAALAGGWQPQMVRAHGLWGGESFQIGGRRLWNAGGGMATPNGTGPRTRRRVVPLSRW